MNASINGFLFLLLLLTGSCQPDKQHQPAVDEATLPSQFLLVLGVAQDAGYPQAGCGKECCKAYWENKETKKLVTSLALVDRVTDQYWLFEASPDITAQLKNLQPYLRNGPDHTPDGIFLSHAHIGHYTGLMQFGREAMGASNIPVYALPRMDSFLRHNGPWSQLVSLNNITLRKMSEDTSVVLNNSFRVVPVRVPHRDEFSETAGFIITNGRKKILFIPDIDKWEKWDNDFVDAVRSFDRVIIDGTFYQNGELPGRDMSEVPHPFVEESMKLLSGLPDSVRSKVLFIHFNHTNPLLKKESAEKRKVKEAGFGVAEEGMIIEF